jgi:hypothetical protein
VVAGFSTVTTDCALPLLFFVSFPLFLLSSRPLRFVADVIFSKVSWILAVYVTPLVLEMSSSTQNTQDLVVLWPHIEPCNNISSRIDLVDSQFFMPAFKRTCSTSMGMGEFSRTCIILSLYGRFSATNYSAPSVAFRVVKPRETKRDSVQQINVV